MPIAVTANSLQHWPSPTMRRPVSHTVRDGRASLSHWANDRQTCYRFVNFWPWGLTAGPKVTKKPNSSHKSSQIRTKTRFHWWAKHSCTWNFCWWTGKFPALMLRNPRPLKHNMSSCSVFHDTLSALGSYNKHNTVTSMMMMMMKLPISPCAEKLES